MRNSIRTVAGMLGVLACTIAAKGLADTAKDSGAASPHTVTANIGGVSNYSFRGITQTWDKPAIQGGIDYTHSAGWYGGLALSSISDKQYADGNVEVDLYGGYNGKIQGDWTWTLGVIGYLYPSANYDRVNPAGTNRSQTYNNVEGNVGVGYKWLSAKVSVALTDYFGANAKTGYTKGSSGTTYVDVTAAVPLPEASFTKDVTLPLHIGHTYYTNDLAAAAPGGGKNPDYTDYKIGITKGFDGGWSVGAAYTYADNKAVYDRVPSAKNPAENLNLGGGNAILSINKTF
ncbi:MAG: hypothetical protein HQL77_18370 [Magnetococcales bacterium]|nr:hypothetical protein [Magnetococcales bacterium]MBF0437311.1 hypothetical protein [Magnetococcales bacterium]